MLHREVYERTPDFEERVAGARLRTYEWQFLANLDGHLTVGEILRRLKIDEATISEFILEQERNGAIAPRLLSFEEFLNSAEAEAVHDAQPAAPARPAAPAQSNATAGSNKRSTGEELRAIARLSIAAALGEILSLISKRRAASPNAAPAATAPAKSAPAASSSAVAAQASPSAAPAQTEASAASAQASAATAATAGASAASAGIAEPATAGELPRFADSEWTVPAQTGSQFDAPEANFDGELPQIDVEYLEAYSEDPIVFDEGPGIAERLLRDYGPIDKTEAPTNGESHVEEPPSFAAEPPSDGEPHRVTFSVNDLAGYVERIDVEAMPTPPNGFYPSDFARPDPAQAPHTESPHAEPPHAEAPHGEAADSGNPYGLAPQDTAPHAEASYDATAYDATAYDAISNDATSRAETTYAEPAPADVAYTEQPYAQAPRHAETDDVTSQAEAPLAHAPNGEASNGQASNGEAHTEAPQPKSDDLTVADPIVFSLSARNPDSFWSGKK